VNNPRIVRIEWARLEGRRPRHAHANSRLLDHGILVRPPIMRVTTEDGAVGFGHSLATAEEAEGLVGAHLDDVFSVDQGTREPWRRFDYPLWDLAGQRAGQPVYELVAQATGKELARPFRVPCYDTSLYIDDLSIESDDEAAALIADEARQGYARGHRAFKIKIGRGARFFPLEQGTRRDVLVIRAVREAVGSGLPIMIDANNGYNLNLTKRVLSETADCGLYWLEEPFHEDAVLYRELREWLAKEGLSVLIADGEGQASPLLLDWAREGVVDVIQYDIFAHGFSRWLATGRQLDQWGARTAPHHYGGHYGNYVTGHLAAGIRGFLRVEWDEATTPGLYTSGYRIDAGLVSVPASPGFGLALDDAVYRPAVESTGYELAL